MLCWYWQGKASCWCCASSCVLFWCLYRKDPGLWWTLYYNYYSSNTCIGMLFSCSHHNYIGQSCAEWCGRGIIPLDLGAFSAATPVVWCSQVATVLCFAVSLHQHCLRCPGYWGSSATTAISKSSAGSDGNGHRGHRPDQILRLSVVHKMFIELTNATFHIQINLCWKTAVYYSYTGLYRPFSTNN